MRAGVAALQPQFALARAVPEMLGLRRRLRARASWFQHIRRSSVCGDCCGRSYRAGPPGPSRTVAIRSAAAETRDAAEGEGRMKPIVAVIAPGMMGSGVGAAPRRERRRCRHFAGRARRGKRRARLRRRDARAWTMRRSRRPTSSCRSCRRATRWVWPSGWRRSLRRPREKADLRGLQRGQPGRPSRASRAVIEATGATFVDGGIIGGPPTPGSRARRSTSRAPTRRAPRC